MSALKEALGNEYGTTSLKNIDKGYPIVIDDRSEADVGSNKQLYSYFCEILLLIRSEDEVEVSLRNNVPQGSDVENWMKKNECEYSDTPFENLKFTVCSKNIDILHDLAICFKNIVKPGAPRYSVPNYKYVCPRTASSLERLASALSKAWRT